MCADTLFQINEIVLWFWICSNLENFEWFPFWRDDAVLAVFSTTFVQF